MTEPPRTSIDFADIPPRPPRLSEEIAGLLDALTEHSISLRDLLVVLKGRAYTLLLIILSLPFCLPVPLPGLSTFFGAIIALIGLRLSLRLEPWLPKRMLDTQLSARTLVRILKPARRLARIFEVLLRPRLSFLVEWTLLHHLSGAMICLSGVLLLLPLPVPLSNIVPALTIIFLSAATLERDGVFVILGIIAFTITIIFFGGIFIGGAAAVQVVREWFSGVPPGD
ncbi:MAG: exopolysaccharide biosynthesis protein [Verrucomicrobiales bacterium]